MTKQGTFDKVAWHMLSQMEKSFVLDSERVRCVYRGPGGLKCAIGFLIPDEEYRSEMENCVVSMEPVAALLSRLGHDLDLCARLQEVHDQYYPLDWKDALRSVARTNGLSDKILQ